MDLSGFQWTREPAGCKISHDQIEIVTKPIRIYGRELIIIFRMTMPLSCRWRQRKNILVLW